MKILIHSNSPWASTGYGNQTRLFVPRLQHLGHEIAISAFYGLSGGVLNWSGAPIYPMAYHPYGCDVVGAHAAHFGADIVITLIDAWVMEPAMFGPKVRWVPWFPIDMEPCPPPVARKVREAYQGIVYSRYGERKAEEAGLDVRYVPHGVDSGAFKPGNRRESRERLKVPTDRYVVGMVAANKGTPSRKAFPQCLEAFARFHRAHPDALLYLHTVKAQAGEHGGVNLPELVEHLGISRAVVFCDQYLNLLGYPDSYMLDLYNSFDMLLAVSMGEGFGIPILEAQSCGCPVVTGGWTSMPEITFGGWMVPEEDAERYWTPLAAYQFLPRIGAVAETLETAYRRSSDDEVRLAARRGAKEYDADLVTERYWRPVLEEIAGRLKTGAGELKLVRF